ncbi:hypothetical protein CANCADRAFT_13891, partial [Tortispora caseinolytica NRRL Y-17796]
LRHASHTVKVPQMAESITEGTLAQWVKSVGESVAEDEEVASIETDKIDVPVNAPFAGVIKEALVAEGDTVTVGQDLFVIEEGDEGSSPASKKEEPAKSEPAEEAKAAPADSKPVEESKEERAASSSPPPKEPAAKPTAPTKSEPEAAAPSASFSRNEERIKMNRMRLRIAERLKESQNTAASLTTFNECDMSSLMEMRKLYKDEIIKKSGVKIGFMGAFTKACTLAMREIPAVNAAIEGNDTMVYRDYVDVSIAVATPKGLVTPVLRNAESRSIVEIENEIYTLGSKARDNKLTLEDMAGGTFTISNGGVFGSLYGTPIINMPQTAVLGLHAVKERAVVVDGKVEARPMMYLALTYDHRMLDGREAVTFLRLVKEYIEDPRKMLL